MNRSRLDQILQELKSRNISLIERTIPYRRGELRIVYVKSIVDDDALAEQIIKPVLQYCEAVGGPLKARQVAESIVYTADCRLDDREAEILHHILDGMAVLLFSNDTQYVAANVKKVAHRPISEPEITYTMRGGRDCFVENLEVNLSLIRYRLKDSSLQVEMHTVGKRTRTNVAVLYMEDIVNDDVLTEVRKRIDAIDIDSVWGTAELQHFLQGSTHALFPQMGTTERSDWACEAVLEGRVVVMGDGGHIALMIPQTFGQFMTPCDDRYDNKYMGLFSIIIRYLALFVTLCMSSLYIAIASFHLYILPVHYAITLAQLRQNVLFTPLIEVLILEFLVELMREALLRVPRKIGPAIGIVGAIVIGQAATSAGIFSPLLLIIVAGELMASFAIPDYFAAHPFRILKFLVIFMTGFIGFYGFTLAFTLILTGMVSVDSFGIPYMAPFAPYNRYDFLRSWLFSRATSPWRQRYLRPKDMTRTDAYHQHFE